MSRHVALQDALNARFAEDFWHVEVLGAADRNVLYRAGGALWLAPYTVEAGDAITIDEPVKTRLVPAH